MSGPGGTIDGTNQPYGVGITEQDSHRYTARVAGDRPCVALFRMLDKRARCVSCFIENLLQALFRRSRVVLQRRVALQVQLAIQPPKEKRLVDDTYRLSNFDHRVKQFNVLGIEAHATVADSHADAVWLVGAMNKVSGHLEFQHV